MVALPPSIWEAVETASDFEEIEPWRLVLLALFEHMGANVQAQLARLHVGQGAAFVAEHAEDAKEAARQLVRVSGGLLRFAGAWDAAGELYTLERRPP